jgi:hypothetical protein
VSANGVKIASWEVAAEGIYSAQIPPELLGAKTRELKIEVAIPKAFSPAAAGLSVDQRELGIKVTTLTISTGDR